MMAFLALLDNKGSNKVFRRSRSAARTLAMKRIAEQSGVKVTVSIPNDSLVFPYQSPFHREVVIDEVEESQYQEDQNEYGHIQEGSVPPLGER